MSMNMNMNMNMNMILLFNQFYIFIRHLPEGSLYFFDNS